MPTGCDKFEPMVSEHPTYPGYSCAEQRSAAVDKWQNRSITES